MSKSSHWRQNLAELIGEPALLELLAEECTELAQAALKLARVIRKENPTPRTQLGSRNKVIEEWADVIICLAELDKLEWTKGPLFMEMYEAKMQRMCNRLEVNEIEDEDRGGFGSTGL